MKKLLSAFLALAMVFSMLPVSALASSPEEDPVDTVVQETILPEENSPAEIFDSFSDAGTTLPEQSEVDDEYMLEYERMLEESRKVDRFIIKPSAAMARSTMRTLGGEAIVVREALSTDVAQPAEYVIVTLEEKVHPEEFIAQVGNSVEFIQPDYEMEISAVATANDDTQVPKAVFDREANLAAAHQISTGSGVTIALLDTGVDMTHPDLAEHFANAWNFVDNSSSVTATGTSTGEAHGTHIAGIIASVAPNATIMPLQVFKYGKAYTSDIVAAIRYAEEHGAQIANCSWGSSADNQVLREAIEASNMLFVTAVGNSRINLDEHPVYPASYDFDNVISVASVNDDGGMSYFSNYGASVDIAAWGRDVVSTLPGGGYGNMMGTSMSAGFVAGTAALAHGNGAAILEVKDILKGSADKLDILDGKTDSGNMLNYFNIVSGTVPDVVTVVDAADDFDVFKEPSPAESWELFSVSTPKQISVGSSHCTLLMTDGTVWTWGNNRSDQLGYSTYGSGSSIYPKPKQVPGLSDIKYISSGTDSNLAIKNDGTLWGWGDNGNGQMGSGTTGTIKVPMQIYVNNLASVKTCLFVSLFLKKDGTVWVAGVNCWGQFGDGTVQMQPGMPATTPQQIVGLSNIKQIASTSFCSAALSNTGDVYKWGGCNWLDKEAGESTPVKLNSKAKAINSQSYAIMCTSIDGDMVWGWRVGTPPSEIPWHRFDRDQVADACNSLILMSDGTVMRNNGTTLTQVMMRTDGSLSPLTGVAAVTSNNSTYFAITQAGDLLSWGDNRDGMIGDGTTKERFYPQKVGVEVTEITALSPVTALFGAALESLPLPQQVEVRLEDYNRIKLDVAWKPTTTYDPELVGVPQELTGTPVIPPGLFIANLSNITTTLKVTVLKYAPQIDGAMVVDGGRNHSLCLANDSTVWAWGDNTYGQLGDGTTVSRATPRQIPGLTDVKEISAGEFHNLALKKDGTLWEWGRNIGNVPIRVDIEGVYNISAGLDFSLVQVGYKTAWAWGVNDKGQLGNGTISDTITRTPTQVLISKDVQAVSAGNQHGLICASDGTIWGWGHNAAGELGEGVGANVTSPKQLAFPRPYGYSRIEAGNQISIVSDSDTGIWYCGKQSQNSSASSTIAFQKITEPDSFNQFGISDISSGYSFSVVQKHGAWVWGDNSKGQLGIGSTSPTDDIVQINIRDDSNNPLSESCGGAVGGYHALLIKVTEERPYRREVWTCGDNTYGQLGDGTNLSSYYPIRVGAARYPIAIAAIEPLNVEYGTQLESLALPKELSVEINGGISIVAPVTWDTSTYDGTLGGTAQTLTGTLTLSDGVTNPSDLRASIVVNVGKDPSKKDITSITSLAGLPVNYGTLAEAVQSKLEIDCPIVTVTLEDGTTADLPVVWDVSGSDYDGTKWGTYTIYGDLDLTGKQITNPDGLRAQIEVTVGTDPKTDEIVSILPVQQDVGQNIWLAPMDKVNTFGVPTPAALPENVTVQLKDETTVQLPVVWDKSGYDPALVGKQTLTGDVVIAEGSEITNPDGLRASLEITVLPKEYEVWDASPKEITLEVLPGTTVAQLNEKLKAEGKAELSVQAIDLSNDFEVITFCGLTLVEEDCAGYSKDVPGVYALTARIPSNFTPLAEDIPGPIVVKVTVLEPLEITAVESARMDAYQSVLPKHLENIPKQVNVTLEGGMVIPVDVEWNWKEYAAAKDTVGDHIVLGDLVNLPSLAKQPEGEEFKANMVVTTTPVDYVVSGVLSENLFEGDGGIGLDELTAILKPTLTMQITSVTEGVTLTTEYAVDVALEQEKNPDFDPEYADLYILVGTLGLPGNITCPEGELYDEILLQTNPVEVVSVEPVYALTTEGTLFADIESLPTQVSVTLSCVGADGQNKKILIDADWGTGEGYNPFPPDLTDDNAVTMEVTGELANWPQYVNGADVSTTLFVTMTRVFDVVAITPNRFPATGAMEVKLGSSLEDIYNLLDTHSVQLTLENPKGETSTVDVTFTLRAEDNPDYDPMTEGTYTLKAHLPLTEKLLNPDSLGVEIIVKTTKYSITSTKAVRVAGVLSGTPFAEVGLPTLATIARNDGKEEDIPVTWSGSAYNPTKIGSQVVRGTLTTPLPVHLENPNNRQPSAVVTIINPAVQILSMTQMTGVPMLMANGWEEDAVPGFVEYRYVAELLHQDGTVTTEIISVFVEAE